ncbi:hypothetical protein GX408_02060 [bacterium]|nr:hypothetical protein [bacterium]
MKRVGIITVKTLVCGLIFFVGTILGGLVASAAGFPIPAMPAGTDTATLAGYLLLASLGIGGLLAYLASRLSGNFLLKWLTLSLFGWVVYSLSTYIEAAIYTTFSSASLYKVVMDLIAFLASSAAAVILFRARSPHNTRETLSRFSFLGWAWRIVLAWTAFPVIYLSFGKLVEPFVIDYYRQGLFELTAPGWEQIISAQMLRSLLFLGVCLAVITLWNRSRTELWIGCSVALYLLVGGFYMLQAYWFPVGFRMIHCLEMFADSITYIGLLTLCFMPKEARNVSQTAPLTMAKQN